MPWWRTDPLSHIHKTVFRAPETQLYGEIEVSEGSSIWPHCTIRAEANRVYVGRYTNLQDFVMIHIGYDNEVFVGDFCSITHHATLHGCRIEDECLVGIQAVVMDGAVIGRGSIIAGGAVVKEGSHFPPNSIIAGTPAKKIGERENRRENRLNAWHYHYNAQAYLSGEHRAWTGPEYATWLKDKKKEVAEDLDLAVLNPIG
jgi:carbonic anhydrase/acetyltransferase-like protein (isoleucine patch superfamily)